MTLWICLRSPDDAGTGPGLATTLHDVALAMLQFSPRVACFRQNSVVLEVAASLSLFGGPLRLCGLIRQAARHLAPLARLGMAPSATGAWLLAGAPSCRRRRVLKKRTLARRLAALPLHSLPETRPHAQWLQGIGCRHLGQLNRLPRQGLQQRSSPRLLQALDAAYARVNESPPLFIPPAAFRLAFDPDFHLERADPLLRALQPLLQALCGWLQGRQAALHEFELLLHHEKGRHARLPLRLILRFSTALWEIDDFNLLLKEHLRHCQLQGRVVRLEIRADAPQPRQPANDTLFPDPARHAQEEQRLLDLLAARLGADSIRRPRPQAHHLPEHANVWAGKPEPPTPGILPASLGAKARPFWLLSCPRQLDVQHDRPVQQGRPLRLIQGPERIETGWHTGPHQRRDYFVAEDPEGARYWIYRERETGYGWFLHGLFA